MAPISSPPHSVHMRLRNNHGPPIKQLCVEEIPAMVTFFNIGGGIHMQSTKYTTCAHACTHLISSEDAAAVRSSFHPESPVASLLSAHSDYTKGKTFLSHPASFFLGSLKHRYLPNLSTTFQVRSSDGYLHTPGMN